MAKWQRTRIAVPEDLKPAERDEFAQKVIDTIRDRTKQRIGITKPNKNGVGTPKEFGEYTKEYAKQKGVSRKAVDLRLSHEMMNSLQKISDQKGSVLIGYDKSDSALNGKVEGNRLGTYGSPKPKPGKKREFLGITVEERQKILDEIRKKRK